MSRLTMSRDAASPPDLQIRLRVQTEFEIRKHDCKQAVSLQWNITPGNLARLRKRYL